MMRQLSGFGKITSIYVKMQSITIKKNVLKHLCGRTWEFFGESLDVKAQMNYLKFPIYDILKDHPRYVELLEKLKNSDRYD